MSSADQSSNPGGENRKKPYSSPVLEFYGNITNFTTGGSRRRSEWKYMSGMSSSSGSSSMMGGSSGGSWSQSMSKKKNVVKS